MTQLLLFVTIGIALLLLVGRLLRGAFADRVSHGRTTPVSAATASYLPPRGLTDRIFAGEDLEFVTAENARTIRKLFLRDRRRMALSWLRQTRRQAWQILQIHLRAVRTDLSLNPAMEVKLVFHALLFFAVYVMLVSMVAIFGAFWQRGFLRHAATLANRLSVLGARILADSGLAGIPLTQSHVRA